MTEDITDIISIDELQETLQVGKNRAYELLNKQVIPAFRIGRCWKIPRRGVEEYIVRQAKLSANPWK